MKNFSITTAFISLLSLYGYESFADESTNRNSGSFLIKMIEDNDNHELESQIKNNELNAQKKENKDLYNNIKNDSAKEAKSLYKIAKNTTSKEYDNVKNKSEKTVDYAKRAINEQGYKLQVGNLLNRKAEHDTDIRRLMNKPNLTFEGNVVSKGWYKTEKDSSNNNVSDTGGNFDAALRLRVENSNKDLNITYGANLQATLAFVDNYIEEKKKEATLFIKNPYGRLSLGYDNGVDAKMRIDGTTLQAGKETLPVNLIGTILSDTPKHKQFYTSPVLWSESIADLSNIYLHDTSDHDPIIKMAKDFRFTHKKKVVNSSLPMRLTFTTSSFLGTKLGISYSMNGYDKKIFTDINLEEVTSKSEEYKKKKNEINDPNSTLSQAKTALDTAKTTYDQDTTNVTNKKAYEDAKKAFDTANTEYQKDIKVLYNTLTHTLNGNLNAPTYKNVINGALVFDYDYYDDIKAKISITGEYAKADNDSSSLSQYTSYYQGHDILAGAIGANVDYMGIKFGASYGYLGKSGLTKSLQTFDEQSATSGGGGTPGFDPYTLGNRGEDDGSIPGDTKQPEGSIQQQPAYYESTPQTSNDNPKAAELNNNVLQTSTKSLSAAQSGAFADDDSKKTYYMTAAIGYQYQKAYFSINYMQSSFQNNKYRNIGAGAEYNLNRQNTNKGDYKLFINYNRFSTEQNNITDTVDNKGYVVSGGLKFEF